LTKGQLAVSERNLEKTWAEGYLSGENMDYVDGLYEDYLVDPLSVSSEWQTIFRDLDAQAKNTVSHRSIREYFFDPAKRKQENITSVSHNKQAEVTQLIEAYRSVGHHQAKLDPLELIARIPTPSLTLAYHGLDTNDLDQVFEVDQTLSKTPMSLRALEKALRETYCESIGIEYMHIANEEEVSWIQAQLEPIRSKLTFSDEKKKAILDSLIAADGLERYLGTRYVGQKRFSLEGGDALIPMIREILEVGAKSNVKEIVMGMAHRGRLNVLVNVLGKSPEQLFQEFEGKIQSTHSGDVKYHMGFSSDVKTASGETLHIALAFNPSHLEIINPVVQGSARSRLRRRHDLSEKNTVLPLVIHGDAAFAGQGVVMETFNFSQSPGYCTGGTVHIVINNQVGFTTSNPLDSRSTLYCTDVAKMVQAPIIHVNGDDPEAVVFAAHIAFAFRTRFKRDVVLDLVCYRRHGHNEADEPAITQPCMYKIIRGLPILREIYAKKLIDTGILSATDVEARVNAYRDTLDRGDAVVPLIKDDYPGKISVNWAPYLEGRLDETVKTAVPAATLHDIASRMLTLPESLHLHPVVQKLIIEERKMMEGNTSMQWGYAEKMAYATLIHDGYDIRLSGQDAGRGTFAHRHSVLHDVETGEIYIPLEHINPHTERAFTVIDSVLSEEAVLAFEYGFSSSEPRALVLWEAQFGDFANGAQVVMDQFISSGEQKWNRLCGLVMLLPHGYEGQGPEHSSARLERYLQLCAQDNMQVCTPTTPAQMFHLLRRQMLRPCRKPLVIMTPKSLLRHKLATSSLEDLTHGEFQLIIPDVDTIEPKKVTRVVLCGGKVYYDLLQKRRDESLTQVAIIRIEQLYPFPEKALCTLLATYSSAETIVFCQEEPYNQGAWLIIQENIRRCLTPHQRLQYAGREASAAPAVGSAAVHAKQQQALILQALQ